MLSVADHAPPGPAASPRWAVCISRGTGHPPPGRARRGGGRGRGTPRSERRGLGQPDTGRQRPGHVL